MIERINDEKEAQKFRLRSDNYLRLKPDNNFI